MTGLNATDGRALDGWPHTLQSIERILTTRVGARIMRRDFGSDLPKLIDENMTPRLIARLYVATAEALDRWEPRFELRRVVLESASADGRAHLSLFGLYYPRGHRGDYSLVESVNGPVYLQQRL